MEQSEQTTWITRLSEQDERYATSSQVLQRELKTAAYILNELCGDKQHYTAHEGPVRLARRSAVLGAVADQQLQRSTCRSQKPSGQASMNRLPWICATRKNVLEMSGRINGPATGGQTPWRSD